MFKSPNTPRVMAEALEIPADDITPDTALGSCAAWTSLSHMRLIFGLEDALDRRLRPDEIVGLTSAGQVDALLAATVP